MKDKLFGKTLNELLGITARAGRPAYTAKQIADWLYQKNASSIHDMTNLSKAAREKLSLEYEIGRSDFLTVQTSVDGTRKYLFPVDEKRAVESAYIPEKERATLCISSQVGCKMGCLFCMTGKQGFQGQLTPGEILNQIASLPEKEKLTNIVYMGMGEPFDNIDNVLKSLEILTSDWGYSMSPRRITVSTIGIIPAMHSFLEASDAHLAISMHTPFEDERKSLMPIEAVYSLRDIIEEVKTYDWSGQRRISFEYIMFKGINDSDRHIKELSRLLNGLKCRINLIRFHPIPGSPLRSSDDVTITRFRDKLTEKGITTTIRASRGEDIFAACGLLSTKEQGAGSREQGE